MGFPVSAHYETASVAAGSSSWAVAYFGSVAETASAAGDRQRYFGERTAPGKWLSHRGTADPAGSSPREMVRG